MKKKLLSIVMPTFDRNRKALENVKRLLPQLLSDEVELILLDNYSCEPLEKTVQAELSSSESSLVRVVRNQSNIGMAGNSLRVFEVGSGEFVWTLCDDDDVMPDAVQQVLDAICSNPDSVYLWFPVQGGPQHRNPGRYKGIASAIRAEPNLFFVALSSCVFRRDYFSQRIRIGYLYAYSWASFMCPLLAEMDNNQNSVYISASTVAKAGVVDAQNKWSKLDACLGIRSLLELPMSKVSRKYLQRSIDSFSFSTARLFFDSTAMNDDQRWFLFRLYLARRYAPLSPRLLFWVIASYSAQGSPRLTNIVVRLLERVLGRRLLIAVEGRFNRS